MLLKKWGDEETSFDFVCGERERENALNFTPT
jgi:hypothetical protein